MTNRRIRPWRRTAEALQALLILGIPFVRIGGESALRFDIPSLRLHVFGTSLWMDEFFVVLIAIIFFTFLIVFITILFGRIWCGWLCPQTVIIDLTGFMDKAASRGLMQKIAAYALTFLVSVIVAASLIWYFVSPYDFFPALMTGSLGTVTWGFWITLTIIIFMNYAFLRHTWCATVCPYAKLQGALFDDRTMIIAFDPRRKDECMDCRACVAICPVHIDIRNGLNAACINCAECIDTCSEKMDRRQKKGLINYFFGNPGQQKELLRQNVVMIGSVTILTLGFLLYLSLARNPIDLTILPNYELKPRLTEGHEVVNAYTVAVKNKGRQDLELTLNAELQGSPLRVIPEKITLQAGEYKRVTALVFSSNPGQGFLSGTLELKLEADKPKGIKLSKKTSFIVPEAK
jgi:cytochrome c oxidase accessory protein FixG